MKVSKRSTYSNASTFPDIRFEQQSSLQLTSFAGLTAFATLLKQLDLKRRLYNACYKRRGSSSYHPSSIFLVLVTHAILGFSRLRDVDGYKNDPLVLRLLNLRQMPSVPTISRCLSQFDDSTLDKIADLSQELVFNALRRSNLRRICIDFDGSVCPTSRHAEGSAVGFNPKKKGQRSYYPLFATIAQTGQVLRFLHRSGNVHDSHKAEEFILSMVSAVRAALPRAVIEVRCDGAFYSDSILESLEWLGVEYSVSVPFERYANFKSIIEKRKRWKSVDKNLDGFRFESKAKCWSQCRQFVAIRKKNRKQNKAPLQLDLFEPVDEEYQYKVIVTNKKNGPKAVCRFHEGRGSQEKIFSELKTATTMGYVPCRKLLANKAYLHSRVFAHNLARELQMSHAEPIRTTNPTRACLWEFMSLSTLQKKIIRRAGRLTRPRGHLTLTISCCGFAREFLTHIFNRELQISQN